VRNLPYGSHTFTIKIRGNSSGSDHYQDVDAFEIFHQ
jgi:hypothetical protein